MNAGGDACHLGEAGMHLICFQCFVDSGVGGCLREWFWARTVLTMACTCATGGFFDDSSASINSAPS